MAQDHALEVALLEAALGLPHIQPYRSGVYGFGAPVKDGYWCVVAVNLMDPEKFTIEASSVGFPGTHVDSFAELLELAHSVRRNYEQTKAGDGVYEG